VKQYFENLRQSFVSKMKSSSQELNSFLNLIFNQLNITYSEFDSALQEVDTYIFLKNNFEQQLSESVSLRKTNDRVQQSRKSLLLFDLAAGLTRVLLPHLLNVIHI